MKGYIGQVIYNGPSLLDGAPIVAIANKFDSDSKNVKTGGMVQTWIIRSDVPPHHAVKSGEDASVCGGCIHRKGSCYVPTWQAPLSVYNAFHNGRYMPSFDVSWFAGKHVRIGSYGDPAAVPLGRWLRIKTVATATTGYTHQWARFPEFAMVAMASVDSLQERMQAKTIGFRTFRVRTATETQPGEVTCPASKEAGHKLTCEQCKACGGVDGRRADIVIRAHSPQGKHFKEVFKA